MMAANSGHIINDYVFSHKSSTLSSSLTLNRGNKEVPSDLAHAVTTDAVLDGSVFISIFRPESAMTISQTSLFWLTPKRQWSMKTGNIPNKKS